MALSTSTSLRGGRGKVKKNNPTARTLKKQAQGARPGLKKMVSKQKKK
jgi:hypothetical protein